MLARLSARTVQLRTHNGADCTGWYPEGAHGLTSLAGEHILDSEVCVLDDVGRLDLNRLQDRLRRRSWYAGAKPVALLAWPVKRRKAALQALLTPAPPGVLYVGHMEEGGDQLYAQAGSLHLEGIVCKRFGSAYVTGARNGDWLKVKRPGAVPAERFRR